MHILTRTRGTALWVMVLVAAGHTGCAGMLLGGGQGTAPAGAASLEQAVSARLAAEPTLAGQPIGVSAAGSVITLRGRVGSGAQKARAEALARDVSGVTAVDNRLAVVDSS